MKKQAATHKNLPPSITVRFVEDSKTQRCWYEEKRAEDKWVMIPETHMACKGNSEHELKKFIEARRQQHLMSFRKVGPEEVFTLGETAL